MSPNQSGTRPELRLATRGGLKEALRLLTPVYAGVVSARNSLYDVGALRARRAGVPVISVGNLSTGGTGKTPFVIWLVQALRALGSNPGVLSRGYGRADGAAENDEGALLSERFPELPQVQQPDRVAGAAALETLGADLIVLDDGFQHRRLARDLDLVLIDTTRPWGLPPAAPGAPPVEALLPRGLLREPLSSLKRADAVIFTRCDQASEATLAEVERAVRRHAPLVPIAHAIHSPARVVTPTKAEEPSWLEGRPVTLLSGVGHPGAFEETARALGADVRAVHVFSDHHQFTRREVEGLGEEGTELLVTAKDAVKLNALGVTCSSLEVELDVIEGEGPLSALVEALVKGGEVG
jgi:tetraacyldisaccharide 4'-kinase